MHPNDLNVFDLDGTLIKVNSFREITKKLLVILLKRFQIVLFATIAVWFIVRKCGLVSHLKFKQHVVDIFEKTLTEEEKRDICQTVFNSNVNKSILEQMVSLDNCIICTAAPFAYASRMFFLNNIPVIASLNPGTNFPDPANFGFGKVANLKAYFKERTVSVTNFYTDNISDDIALIDFAVNAFMVTGDHLTKLK